MTIILYFKIHINEFADITLDEVFASMIESISAPKVYP
jgi:hypothetical protein